MKKLFILIAIVSITTASFAQGNINKGDWMIGGDAGYTSSKTEYPGSSSDDKTKTFNLSPNVGYFFIKQLAGGLRVVVSSTTEEYKSGTSTLEDKETFSLIGPFLRYYFLPATQKMNIFADATYGFGSNKSTPSGGTSSKSDLNGYGLTGGLALFLHPAVALEFALKYQSLENKFKSGSTTVEIANKSFGFGVGLQIHLAGKGGGMQRIDPK